MRTSGINVAWTCRAKSHPSQIRNQETLVSTTDTIYIGRNHNQDVFSQLYQTPFVIFPRPFTMKRETVTVILLLCGVAFWCQTAKAGVTFLSPSQKPLVHACICTKVTWNAITRLRSLCTLEITCNRLEHLNECLFAILLIQ